MHEAEFLKVSVSVGERGAAFDTFVACFGVPLLQGEASGSGVFEETVQRALVSLELVSCGHLALDRHLSVIDRRVNAARPSDMHGEVAWPIVGFHDLELAHAVVANTL